jgi:hypothetical protein
MPGIVFQATVGTTAVQLSAEAELAGAKLQAGVKVVTPAGNSGLLYYGFASGVTTTTGCHIPNGSPFTINPAEFPTNSSGQADFTALYFISDAAGQVVTGVVL